MNERFEKMMLEATKDMPQGYYVPKEFIEKFAELIIRECCGILTENVEVALDASGSPVYPEGLICEHFGVEE